MKRSRLVCALVLATAATLGTASAVTPASKGHAFVVNDSHFHLTNYVQQGTDIHDFLKIMGDKVGRVALFGIPLQQTWSYGNTGRLRADVLPADRRAALLLLVHRRVHRDGVQVAVEVGRRLASIP